MYSENTDAIAAYLSEHPNDQYTDLFYVTGEVSATRLDTLSMVRANAKQIIHVCDFHHNMDDEEEEASREQGGIPEDFKSGAAELGIGLLPMDISNIKGEMERLNLG
jgi:hypothetical protein